VRQCWNIGDLIGLFEPEPFDPSQASWADPAFLWGPATQNVLMTIHAAGAVWRSPANVRVMICPDAVRTTLMPVANKRDRSSAVPPQLE
jgi:hypothetical protein